jgi:predicted O-methyltransferase YrrM
MDKKMILKEIEKQSKEMSWPIIGPQKGKLLEKIVEYYQPKNILEVGTLVGYSSILMSLKLPAQGKITTIEINPKVASVAKKNFEKAGLKKTIKLVVGDAMAAIPKLQGPFDLLFLDGAKDEYYSYILLAENKLSPSAIVVADNVKLFEYELRDYLDYVRVNKNFDSEYYEFDDDAMEVSFKV